MKAFVLYVELKVTISIPETYGETTSHFIEQNITKIVLLNVLRRIHGHSFHFLFYFYYYFLFLQYKDKTFNLSFHNMSYYYLLVWCLQGKH